ncbi:MAG TPA: hypothetical protein VF299_04840, partial [Mycobacterium sp.]
HPYAQHPVTDINDLTLRCGPHHQLITSGGWKTRRNGRGDTQTIPPPHQENRQARVNFYHHPERLLLRHNRNDQDEDAA